MATTKIVLFKSKKLKDDKYPVMLCLRNGDSVKYFGLKQSATISQWDEENGLFKKDKRVNPDTSRDITDMETNRVKKEVTDSYGIKNEYLMSRLLKANEIIKGFEKNNIDWTFQMFEDAFQKKSGKVLFLEYLDDHIQKMNDAGRFGNANTFINLRRIFLLFDKDKKGAKVSKFYFQDMNTKTINKFIEWLRQRECTDNTIGFYLRSLRAVLNQAIKDGVGAKQSYPFSTEYHDGAYVKISDFKAVTKKRFIPHDYLLEIKNKIFDDTKLEYAKHMFLFSFYCFGISFKDMALLNKKSIEHSINSSGELVDIIIYRRCKTKKDYRIQINKDLRGEIEWFENNYPSTNEYLLPIIIDERQGAAMTAYINSKRKKYSQRLKELAKVLEFPEALGDISTYYSRHSYAMALRGKGANVDVIQQAMGHSNSTTTQIYLEGFDEGFMAKMSEDLI